jgi:hypothetical protein
VNNSVAIQVIEYRVITTCGRIFSWSATSLDALFYEFKRDTGLSISQAMPFADDYDQLQLNSEYEGGKDK